MEASFHGFAFWFDVEFSGPAIFPSNNYVNDLYSHDSRQTKKRGKNDEVIVLSNGAWGSSNTLAAGTGILFCATCCSLLSLRRFQIPFTLPFLTSHQQLNCVQTLLYFYDPIEVEQDQVIKGSITLSRSQENPRFLNIHLEYS